MAHMVHKATIITDYDTLASLSRQFNADSLYMMERAHKRMRQDGHMAAAKYYWQAEWIRFLRKIHVLRYAWSKNEKARERIFVQMNACSVLQANATAAFLMVTYDMQLERVARLLPPQMIGDEMFAILSSDKKLSGLHRVAEMARHFASYRTQDPTKPNDPSGPAWAA